MSVKITISRATKSHLSGCLALIPELAEYEKAPQEVELSLKQFEDDFSKNAFNAFVAIDNSNKVLGMALYYPIYSTWKGRSIHLQDLIVKQAERRNGKVKCYLTKLLKRLRNKM